MRDPWVWPDNPAYPPWPHLRYPLTSKDEDPNKKILARQSCSRERRTLLFYLTRTAYHALPHTKHANNSPTTRDTPILGCLLTRDPWVLPAKPDIPPTAAPPEASYRRPEDNIVLSRPPSIPCTTSHKTHRQTLQQKAPLIRGAFWARSMGSARQTGHTPHGRTSATPSPQRMKILTKSC